jgi:hypothetical protein
MEVQLQKLRILGVIFGITVMILVGLLFPTFSNSASAHTATYHPMRVTQTRGDYLSVNRDRRGCTYTVHFTLSRPMIFNRHFQVQGPNHPSLLWVRGNQAVAAYQNYNNRCLPDRQHRAWQFVLISY